ncbi:hypothetical protein EYF80_056270 [Liparis tanakae]|uniref:Uncharacterized protein n=1 Tax=Liparis tanakae TaxID=230148 RepID=A0A4Z2EX83_9TELE|nr:hypothetical protein EYF80_056270 [Liparis tanakae]
MYVRAYLGVVPRRQYGVLHPVGPDHRTHTLQWLLFNRTSDTHPKRSEPRAFNDGNSPGAPRREEEKRRGEEEL